MKCFDTIYSERQQDAGWNVVQAGTLLAKAIENKSSSFIIYSALELRIAIEQLVFTIVAVAKGKIDPEIIKECKKKDGLFRVLREVQDKYTLKCKFANAMGSFYPEIPDIAEWDIKRIKRYYTSVSDLCHSQLIIEELHESPKKWEDKIQLIQEVYEFFAINMKKGTGVLDFKGADPIAIDLWDLYSTGKITLQDVKERFALAKPVLDSNKIIK